MKNDNTQQRPKYPIESVDNALKLLLMFSTERTLGVTEVSERLGVARSTAHRLLVMLQYHGFVQQDAYARVYHPGPAMLQVGLAAVQSLDVRTQARPVLERLVRQIDETGHLVLLQGRDVLFVDCVESTKALRAGARVGGLLPAHCTAAGKALLSEIPGRRLQELYPDAELSALTANTVTSLSALESELAEVRARGFAINEEESETGLRAVAATIHDRAEQPVAAITIAGPAQRMGKARLDEIAGLVVSAVEEVSQRLEGASIAS